MSDLDAASADAAINEQVAYFAALGRTFEWKLYGHDRPGDLPRRLHERGFVPEDEETLMIAPVSAVPTDPRPPEGIRLVPVTDAAGVRQVVHDQARRCRTLGRRRPPGRSSTRLRTVR